MGSASRFVAALAEESRVIMIGGLAVIGHGFDRKTKDSDIWLEPRESVERWATFLAAALEKFPAAKIYAFSQRDEVSLEEAIREVADFGVLRINGLSIPVDIFRKPNQCELEHFEDFWENSTAFDDGTRLPDPIDLYLTKIGTGRDSDNKDLVFLEDKIRETFEERLPECGLEEARTMLARFSNPVYLEMALKNPDPDVRAFAVQELELFAAEGDPFSPEILERFREG